MDWYCLPLLPQVTPDAERAWVAAWEAAYADTPMKGGGLFRKMTGKAGDSLYFSPEAEELADIFGARRCEKPSPHAMRLIAGDPKAWQTHFAQAIQASALFNPASPPPAGAPAGSYASTAPMA